eukprot:Filipodium_phascolosomae@DN53_c0_g1_i1.p1
MANPVASLLIGKIDLNGNKILGTAFDKGCDSRKKDLIEDFFMSVLSEAASTFSPLVREKKTSPDYTWFLMLDRSAELVYAVVCRQLQYAERHAFGLIGETMDLIQKAESADHIAMLGNGGLKGYRKNMKDLLDKYQNVAKFDKTAEVQQKVDNVKDVMESNVRKVMDNNANLDVMQEKTDHMKSQADQFQRGAGDLSRQLWLRQLKLKILLGLLIVAIFLSILIPIIMYVIPTSSKSSSSAK